MRGAFCFQVGEAARRSSTVARRSSVVTPSLAAILGKVEAAPGALTFEEAPAGGPAVGSRLDGQAFFPDLPQLAKVRSAQCRRIMYLTIPLMGTSHPYCCAFC